ncbi:MAG: zinc ribbon domain-containing protein [Bacilli bacterium]|nr:zinc ribbon domain-containing protein [Bacilli bacterium]
MSLIRCPECKQPMSDTISVCPHCGYNLTDKDKIDAYGDAILNPVEMKEVEPVAVEKKKEIPEYLESEATVKINNKTYVNGHLRVNKGMFSFKRGESYWTHTRYYSPADWEDIVNIKAIVGFRSMKVRNWDSYDGTVDALIIKTRSGTIIHLTPVDYKRFQEYLEANDIPYLSEEELNIPQDKIGYSFDHNQKVGVIFLLIFLGAMVTVFLLVGLIGSIK